MSVPLEWLKPRFPALLVFGGETDGVSQEVIDLADAVVSITMHGMANSLNVSMTAAILLYKLGLAADAAAWTPFDS